MKAFADEKIIVGQMISVFDRIENIVEKRKKMLVTSIFFPFPTMFLKGLFLRVVKSPDCVVKVKKQFLQLQQSF